MHSKYITQAYFTIFYLLTLVPFVKLTMEKKTFKVLIISINYNIY